MRMLLDKKFLVLGGGQMGRIVATHLAKCGGKVTVADCRKDLVSTPNYSIQYFNARDVASMEYRKVLGKFFTTYDVVVGCLPSHAGAPCVELAATYGVNYVDLSFTNEDLQNLDPLAKQTRARILIDCGVAPGLPNLIVGHFLQQQYRESGDELDRVNIYVGGNAQNPKLNLGYVETWSLEDLYEEYTRLAHYVENGEIKTVKPTSMKDLATFPDDPDLSSFEAFTSDGLRSLLKYKNIIPNMREWTLRYCGHMEQICDLLYPNLDNDPSIGPPSRISKEEFVSKFREKLSPEAHAEGNQNDRINLVIDCGKIRYTMSVDGDEKGSAMARCTAYTCAECALFLAENNQKLLPGVMPLEMIGNNISFYNEIISRIHDVAKIKFYSK